MKSFKLFLAVGAISASALFAAQAAEALLSPRAAANAPKIASTNEASKSATGTAAGHDHCSMPGMDHSGTTGKGDAMAHCKMAPTGQKHMGCCN
ncbi:MAG TPA: hypothetical protein VMF06_09745 [Candidatus Limnocylindria bacterium]|jgi:uncharacterized protein involved in copper resistance|nr:hypothetical protein [Candidatus Limnocylindria bacterium]